MKWGLDPQEDALRARSAAGRCRLGARSPEEHWGVLGAGEQKPAGRDRAGGLPALLRGVVAALREGEPPPVRRRRPSRVSRSSTVSPSQAADRPPHQLACRRHPSAGTCTSSSAPAARSSASALDRPAHGRVVAGHIDPGAALVGRVISSRLRPTPRGGAARQDIIGQVRSEPTRAFGTHPRRASTGVPLRYSADWDTNSGVPRNSSLPSSDRSAMPTASTERPSPPPRIRSARPPRSPRPRPSRRQPCAADHLEG